MPDILSDFSQIWFFSNYFFNNKFHWNWPVRAALIMRTDRQTDRHGQTDMTKLIGAFRHSTNNPNYQTPGFHVYNAMDIGRKFIKILEDVVFSYPLNGGRKPIQTDDKETDSSTSLWKLLLSLNIIRKERRSEESFVNIYIYIYIC